MEIFKNIFIPGILEAIPLALLLSVIFIYSVRVNLALIFFTVYAYILRKLKGEKYVLQKIKAIDDDSSIKKICLTVAVEFFRENESSSPEEKE